MDISELMTLLSQFLTGVFQAIGTTLTQSASNTILALFLLAIPLGSLAVKWLFTIVNKRRGSRRR